MATQSTNRPPAEVIAEIRAVVARAKAGDAAAVPELRAQLDRHPELWRRCGDAAAQAERAWVDLAAGPDLHLRECMARFAAARRIELTRPSASPAERMLVDRVVTCGLQLDYFSALEANSVGAKDPPKLHQWWAKRHAQAQRAFQAALSSLLTVQKLFPVTPTLAAASTAVAEPVAVAESESLSGVTSEAAPAAVVVQVEEQPEFAPFQPTGWTESIEQPVRIPIRLTVRA